MGKNKLKKFDEISKLSCVLEYPRQRLISEGFPNKGTWKKELFLNQNPITLELGCGKGEYTVALAKANQNSNFIGVDIKGARLWTGARQISDEKIQNALLLRTEIENITSFFNHGEIDEIWITFPDPQMQKLRKRLTSTRFLKLYGEVLKPGGVIHLKTDSPFLYEYTRRLVKVNNYKIINDTDDLYGDGNADPVASIKTFYESQWLSRGKKIKLLSFSPSFSSEPQEPKSDDIPRDDYRAYSRHTPLQNNNI